MGKELIKIPNLNNLPVTLRFMEEKDGLFEIEYDNLMREKYTHDQIIKEVTSFLKMTISALD